MGTGEPGLITGGGSPGTSTDKPQYQGEYSPAPQDQALEAT